MLTFTGCRVGVPTRHPSTRATLEQELFRAVIGAVRTEPGPAVAVDLRPLAAGPQVVDLSDDQVLPISHSDSASRARAVRDAGLELADASQFAACSGWTLVSIDSIRARGCPETAVRIVIVSLSRKGAAQFPNGQRAYMGANVDTTPPLRTVRLLRLVASRRGAALTSFDYVFGRSRTGWVLRARVPIFIYE